MTFDVILHPTDFTPEADQAFRLACAIARDHFAEVIVLHVMQPDFGTDPQIENQQLDESREDVHFCREQFGHLKSLAEDVPVRFRLVRGYPVGIILNVAHEEDANLIVIASSHRKLSPFQLHGNVADGVLRQAHCPVCCLRQPISTSTRPNVPCETATSIK